MGHSRNFILPVFCSVLLFSNVYGFVKRDVLQTPNPNILEPVERNLNQFLTCLDQTLAAVAGQVNVKQLQPVFDTVGDQLNRFSKVLLAAVASQVNVKQLQYFFDILQDRLEVVEILTSPPP